jgi:hypothetical protein
MLQTATKMKKESHTRGRHDYRNATAYQAQVDSEKPNQGNKGKSQTKEMRGKAKTKK